MDGPLSALECEVEGTKYRADYLISGKIIKVEQIWFSISP